MPNSLYAVHATKKGDDMNSARCGKVGEEQGSWQLERSLDRSLTTAVLLWRTWTSGISPQPEFASQSPDWYLSPSHFPSSQSAYVVVADHLALDNVWPSQGWSQNGR
jgi:hypothetical protein